MIQLGQLRRGLGLTRLCLASLLEIREQSRSFGGVREPQLVLGRNGLDQRLCQPTCIGDVTKRNESRRHPIWCGGVCNGAQFERVAGPVRPTRSTSRDPDSPLIAPNEETLAILALLSGHQPNQRRAEDLFQRTRAKQCSGPAR